MSKQPDQTSRIVRVSTAVYRRTLLAYPPAFRHEYGTHMVQVFRDCSREAMYTDGSAGLRRFWRIAFGDLVVSAFAERRQEEVHMSRTFWIRLGSIAGVFGGLLTFLATALQLTLSVLQLHNANSSLGLTLFPYAFTIDRAMPALLLFYVLTLIGLQACGIHRAGAFGWIGITLAFVGEIIAGLGSIPRMLVLNSQAAACRTPLMCNFYDPNGYFRLSFMAGIVGAALLFLGLMVYGIVALRRKVLARANALPLVLGLVTLADVAASAVSSAFSSGTDYAGEQKLALLVGAIALATALVWLALGAALWPRVSSSQGASTAGGIPVQAVGK